MNNQELAELAFEYFIENGEVTIGDYLSGELGDTLSRINVVQELDGEALMMVMSKAKLLWTDITDEVNAFQDMYTAKAFEMILNLIDKHYVE